VARLVETGGGRPATALSSQDARSSLVEVHITAASDRGSTVARLVDKYDGNVVLRSGDQLIAALPLDAVTRLTESAAVQYIRQPDQPVPTAGDLTSEGLSVIGADSVQASGYTGEDVTVAVIDLGFNASNPEIADNVVRTHNIKRSEPFKEESDAHGTAVAEVVTDTAPNTSLVLVSVDSVLGIRKAIEYIDTETSADLVVMSLGIYIGPFDGSSVVDEDIATSTRNGTPYFVSAGNAAGGKHLDIDWSDPDSDGELNFAGDDERLGVSTDADEIELYVNWRDFPTSDEDYDIALYNGSGEVVAVSSDRQAGGDTDRPVEAVTLSSPSDPPYSLAIVNASANGTATFDIFANDETTLEYSTSARSVTAPATEETAIAVGATEYADNRLESFSSRGPTVDGRRKPDLVGPDGVTTSTRNPFYGTSAAAPHAAGVAALMLDANTSLSSSAIEQGLTGTADPIEGTEPNNRTGAGLVNATAAVEAVGGNISQPVDGDIVVAADGSGDFESIQAGVDAAAEGDTVEVRPGTYVEQVRVEKNITLIAPDGATLDGSSFGGESSGIRVPGLIHASPTISGFTMTGYGDDGFVATYSRGSWTVRNLTVYDVGGSGLDADHASGDWTATNVTVEDAGEDGVDVHDTTGNWTLSKVVVDGGPDDGIDVSGSTGAWTVRDAAINGTAATGIEAHDTAQAWTVQNVTVGNTGSLGIYTENATGDWRVRDVRLVNTSYGVYAENTTGDWVVRDSTIEDTRGVGVFTVYSEGAWTLAETRVQDGSDSAVEAFGSTGDWTVENSTLSNNSGTVSVTDEFRLTGGGVGASQTTGEWLVKNSTIDGNLVGVFASGAEGDWTIADTRIRNNAYSGIAPTDATGDWTVRNTTVRNHSNSGIVARGATGAWTVTRSTLRENGGTVVYVDDETGEQQVVQSHGIDAINTTGAWQIHESVIVDNGEDGSVAVNATGADPAGNASYNYWGAPDGPSGDFPGSGDAAVGNLTVEPFYTDEALNTTGGFDDNAAPTVDATLLTAENNVGSPVRFSVTATDSDGTIQAVTLVNDSGAVLDRASCGEANCTATLSTMPTETAYDNESGYVPRTYHIEATDDAGAVGNQSVSTTVAIAGDATGDGQVNIFDAVAVGRSWQATRGGPGYSDEADLNNDGVVNIFDAVTIGRNWQERAI
jgi:subtilisin family serine protease